MTDETAAPTPHPEDQRLDLEDLLPTQPIIWGADDELGGWKDDPWTYEKWARVAGHGPMANGTGCEQCGYDTSMCMFAQFHDAMVTTVIRELDKIGALTLARPVPQGTEDSDYREQIAQAVAQECWAAAKVGAGVDAGKFVDAVMQRVSPLVEQLRQARAAYNRMAAHAVDRAAERDRYYLAWQSAARGRRQARIERDRQGDLTVARRVLDEVAKKAVWLESETQRLRADLEARTCERDEARQELAGEKHVRRLNEHGLLGQLAALRSIAVVLPEDWRQMLADGDYPEQVVDLIESWRAAPVEAPPVAEVDKSTPGPLSEEQRQALVAAVESGTYLARDGEYYANLPDCERCEATGRLTECPDCDGTGKIDRDGPVEAETPARPTGMVYLLDQYDRLLSAVEHIRMDTPEDRDRHARVIATFRRAAEPVREQVEGAALPEVEITDEHVREHDDAASTRDEVVEAWAATWDGDDRTPEWVRVVEPCPVPDCAIPQVHGHEGYGLRFTPAAQPEPQGEPDEDWCGRFADDGKHYCPEGHNTVYQMFSGGREWYCADCGTQGTYPPAPADVGPRARLLTQSGGAAELKRQMDKHLAHPDEETPND